MGKQVYPEPTVGALIAKGNGQVLLCKSPKFSNKFTLPGGHIEVGESIEEALRREVREETGVEVKPVGSIAVYNAIFPEDFFEKRHFIFIDYLCKLAEGRVKVDKKEITEAVWIKPEKALEELDLETYTKRAIKRYLAGKRKEGEGKGIIR